MIYVFGNYELDTDRYELRRAGVPLQIEPKVFDLLTYLIQQYGRTIAKGELLDHLWPQQYVSEGALAYCIMAARRAIGDTGGSQRLIKTLRGRGYRFIAAVQERLPAAATGPARLSPDAPDQHEPAGADQVNITLPADPPLVEAPWPVPFDNTTDAGRYAAEHVTPVAERRQLTVLVWRLVGVSTLSEPLDPEDLRDVIGRAQAEGREVMRRFEGHMAQYLSDGLVVYFGYPRAHEDDAYRAVRTGLDLVTALRPLQHGLERERGVRLAVRVGVHTGVVVVDAMGHADETGPLALGDTPDIAMQLQGLAKPDTVLLSPSTLRLIEGYFVCQLLGSYMLDSLSQPLAVYRALHESAAQSRLDVVATARLTPLVGREQEVALLLEHWERVKDGMGQVVLLSGEVGIGKSRLIQRLKEHVIGEAHARLEYRCSPYYQNSALYPVVDGIQRRLQLTREELPHEKLHKLESALQSCGVVDADVMPLLAALLAFPLADRDPPLSLTPQRQKQKTLEALLTWVFREAEQQVMLIIGEDLQWVDPSTLEFLSLLIDQIPTARILMLLTSRADFRPPWAMRSHLTQLALGRLSSTQATVMIAHVAGNKALPTEVVRQLVARTDGVPLFVEELTKMVLEAGFVKERAGQYELTGPLPPLAIPTTLQDSLMARLDRLGSAKQVAQLGATLGREFSYELIQALTPLDAATLQRELAQLVETELLYQRGLPPQAKYLFKHALIQEVAYASLLRRTRQQYHQRIAQVLLERFPETRDIQPELLAYHYTEAGVWHEAVAYWQKAGQQATERSAHLEAIGHLTTGLAVLKGLPDTPARSQQELALHVALGVPLTATKGYAALDVEQTYAQARVLCRQVGETPQLFPALHGLVRFYLVRGELQTARELGEECLSLAQRLQDPALLLEAQGILGVTLFYCGELAPALTLLQQVMARYDPRQHYAHAFLYGQDPGVPSLGFVSIVLWFLGYPTQALQKCQEMIALAQQLAHPYSLTFAAFFAAWLYRLCRDMSATQERAEAVIVLATEHGFPLFLAMGLKSRGWALAAQGQAEEGIREVLRGLEAYRMTGAEAASTQSLALLAETYGYGGQSAEGLRVLDEALTAMHRGERFYTAEVYRLRGELLLAQTDNRQPATDNRGLADAETCMQQALDVARQQGAKALELRAARSLGRLWQRQGQRDKAHQLLAPVYNWFTEGFETADLQEAEALLEELES